MSNYFDLLLIFKHFQDFQINPLMGILKLHSDSNTVTGTLIEWPLMGGLLHLVQQGGVWVGPQPAQTPPRCTKRNSPPINGQCTNFILSDVAL